jgi:hypothetical protein
MIGDEVLFFRRQEFFGGVAAIRIFRLLSVRIFAGRAVTVLVEREAVGAAEI